MRKRAGPALDSEVDDAIESLRSMVRQAHRLVIFRSVMRDPVVAALLDFLEGIAGGRLHTAKAARRVAASYSSFFAGLCSQALPGREAAVGTPWQNHLLNLVLRDENPFSKGAERHGMGCLGPDLILQVEGGPGPAAGAFFLAECAGDIRFPMGGLGRELAGLGSAAGRKKPLASHSPTGTWKMKRRLSRASDWSPLVAELGDFYSRNGTGIFGEFRAFHWNPRPPVGEVAGHRLSRPLLPWRTWWGTRTRSSG